MTDCARYEPDLKAYADGELSWLRRRAVARHLTHCASCREEIAAMTQITEDLRTSEPGDGLPPSLREKLLADVPLALSNEEAKEKKAALKSGSPIIGGRGVSSRNRRLAACTFAALAVVAWFVFYPQFQQVHEDARRIMPAAALPPPMAAENQMVLPVPIHRSPPVPRQALAAPALSSAQTDAASVVQALPDTDPEPQRQVHKEASIGLQVPNPDTTGDQINDMVKETGGYVAANNLTTGDDGMKSGELIVKVPEPQFETFLAHVAKLGVVQSKNITGEDITEKASDASQAQTVEESDLEQVEARLKALGPKAKWEDTQNAEDLRVQLAQTRARLVLLKRMAALGTLTIDLSQTPKAVPAPPVTSGFTGTLKAATHDALQSLIGSASALLALVIWLLAYAPIWVPLLLLGRYALKEYKKREAI